MNKRQKKKKLVKQRLNLYRTPDARRIYNDGVLNKIRADLISATRVHIKYFY